MGGTRVGKADLRTMLNLDTAGERKREGVGLQLVALTRFTL